MFYIRVYAKSVAAKSATGFGRPDTIGAQPRFKRFFCACHLCKPFSMGGLDGEDASPAGIHWAGRPTPFSSAHPLGRE